MKVNGVARSLAYGLIALSLGMLLAGCPQAAGGQGEQGIPGNKGDSGDPGSPGYDALQAKRRQPPLFISLPELVDDQGNPYVHPILGSPTDLPAGKTRILETIDLTRYFAGGQPPVKYALSGLASSPVEATITAGRLAYKVDVPPAGFVLWANQAALFKTRAGGWDGTITATDAKGVTATATIHFRMNRLPQSTNLVGVPGQRTAVTGTIAQPPPTGAFLLGTSSAEREHPAGTKAPKGHSMGIHKACPKYNECELDVYLSDEDDPIIVIVEGMSRKGAATTEYVRAVPVPYVPSTLLHALGTTGTNLKFVGLKSTWDAATSGHVPVRVDTKATDTEGIIQDEPIYVAVDQAPMLTDAGKTLVQGKTFTVDENDEVIHTKVGEMFRDIEERTAAPLTYAGVSGDAAVATFDALANAGTAITVDPVGIGTATMKVVATDERNQKVELEFMVNVTNIP